jgi:glycosyltransferase involved in cell wall biosynthesis
MKVLHVIDSMNPKRGGLCQAVRTMITGLTQYDVLNEVVCLDNQSESFIKHDSFKVFALGMGSNPWNYNPALGEWLQANLPRYNIVIVHGMWLYYGFATQKAMMNQKSGSSTKVFLMPHGMLDPYFQKAPGRKLKAIRNWIYWKLIESKLVNNVDGLLFTSDEERRISATTFTPYQPKNELVVGLGVNEPPPFHPDMNAAFADACPEMTNKSFLLFLGRIDEKKGIDLLLNAYLKILAEPEISMKEAKLPYLLIAGPGQETPYGTRMQQLVQSNPSLQPYVYFTGMLTGNAKWGAFYACEGFVLSSHQENFGIAVVESLACSRPVLISNQVNIWKEIEQSGAGKIATDTIEGTASLISYWMSLSADQKEQLFINARAAFVNHFSISSAAHKTMKAISGKEQLQAI